MSKLSLLAVFVIVLASCNPSKKPGRSVKFQQYFVEGDQLYTVHCSNCHQKSGKGLGLLYPPLDESDYMEENLSEVICLIKNGKSGELMVNGQQYNQPMPGIPTLTDLEIAEIATFIYNSWSHDEGIIEVQQVTKMLQKCKEGT
ncbi:MAG: cytochrome c [Cyclobacteriaceae bacterium]|nr:cytochrome c [Cyclobacteriaceae bacterium]